MSQRKIRQTSEEIMAQREANESNENENASGGVSNMVQFPAEKPEELGEYLAPTEGTKAVQAECPFCHNPLFITADEDADDQDVRDTAAKMCNCPDAKLARQGSSMGKKIDMLFGAGSKEKYGFSEEHDPEELNTLKSIGLFVAQRKIKGVSVALENGDKAVIQVVRDNTIVRHTKAIKGEAQA